MISREEWNFHKQMIATQTKRGQWLPFKTGSETGVDTIPLDQAMQMARREYGDKASMFESDQSQFGMTENEWINNRAQEIMAGDQVKSAGGGKMSYDEAVRTLEARAGRPLTNAEKIKVKARFGGINPGAKLSGTPGMQIPGEAIQQLRDTDSPESRQQFDEIFGKGTAIKVLGKSSSEKKPEMAADPIRSDHQSTRNRVVKRNEEARDKQLIIVKEIAKTNLSALSKTQIKILIDKLDASTFGVTGYLDDDVKDQRSRLRKAYKAAGGKSLGRSGS